MGYRVTVDTGGTFSDFVVLDEATGQYKVLKVPSTPDDPGRAVLDGLADLAKQGVALDDIGLFSHGTTVATNALLQERGARTGLVVTAGFRGIYETMEQSRPFGPALFDLQYKKPALLAPEQRTVEVVERIGPDGSVRIPLDQASVDRAVAVLEEQEVEAVAVCLLFSFMNPDHEARIAETLRKANPQWWVTTSSELLPQIREYYRLSTTVINGYVSPVLGRYVTALEAALDERAVAGGRRFVMQSNGGSAPLRAAADRASGTILSGPAGGVTAGRVLAGLSGAGDVITFDMGGTSCDVALIHQGEPIITDRGVLEGRHISLPMLDINTVSAGGGTIASVDEHGALHVGPHSAGAVPGPACYGKGGTQATVTDADVVLGYLNPTALLGGALGVDAAAATDVVRRTVAEPLGVDVLQAADGIVRLVNVRMAQAIKAISTERGFDLRDFTLIAFGGAGPVHACQIAADMGIPRVLVPPAPGATSAIGLLLSDVKHDYVRSRLCNVEDLDEKEATDLFAELEAEAVDQLQSEGFQGDQIRLRYFMDMRYAGQGYENPVPVDVVPLGSGDLREIRLRFDEIHRQCHGHAAPGQAVEVVNYRVEGVGLVPEVQLPLVEAGVEGVERALVGRRPVAFLSVADQPMATPVYDRARLGRGDRFAGPAIVEQYDTTVVVGPGQMVDVDERGCLVVTQAATSEVPETVDGRNAELLRGAIGVGVISQSLGGVVQEMQNSLFCTGYSTIIRESRDASCAIMDAQGSVIAQYTVLPLHLGAFPACVEGLLQEHATATLRDGDSFVINHPYLGGSPHATDVAVISPIIVEGRLFGFSGSIAHKTDIGGLVPGTNSGQAREIFHEGLLLPAVRLADGGRPVQDVERIIRANSRTPELVLGDLRGQVGATRLGADRVRELCHRYGTDLVLEAVERLFAHTEQRVRSVVRSWPDGTYDGESTIHNDGMEGGNPIRLRVRTTIEADRIRFDFSRSHRQTTGPYNIRPPLVRAVCYYAMKCLIGHDLPSNAGLASAIETTFGERTIFSPESPAPVNTYMPVAVATAEAIFDSLGQAVPEARIAESSSGTNGTFSHSVVRHGYPQVQYELPAGAIGARATSDGVSASKAHVANGSLMSIEIIETEFPVEMTRFELLTDSGGAGRYRGGLAYVREYRLLADAMFATRAGKQLAPARGRAGGGDGSLARTIVNPGTAGEREIAAADGNVMLSADDVVRMEQPGGGGYGDPRERPVAQVEDDVRQGYVSEAASRSVYGIDPVDECAAGGQRSG